MPDEDIADNPVIQEAQKRFTVAEEAERDRRAVALDALQFRAGNQWPENIKRMRETSNPPRPCLTINVLPARERQVLNDQRQNRPAIHVNPVDDKGDQETAEILQGLIRHIEYDSNADVAYDTAFAAAVRGGFGYIRVITEQEDPLDFSDNPQQVIKIKRVRNAFSVYMDPDCQEPDYSDAKYCLIVTNFSKDEYKDAFPDSDLTEKASNSLTSWEGIGDRCPGWLQKDGTVRVAEYYRKKTKKVTVCKYADGRVRVKDKNSPVNYNDKPIAEKEMILPVIEWYKLNAIEILEESICPGQYIPVIPVLGDELEIDGKVLLEGMIQHTKDAIRMSNYMASAQVETITQPNPPWVVPAGSIEDFMDEWNNAGTSKVTVLRYNPVSLGTGVAPPPQRNNAEPAILAISQARAQFTDDLKAITGIYDAQLGNRSNEQSGRAIDSRKVQGEVSNFHYIDNLSRGMRQVGRVVLGQIPEVYDTPRVLRIIGEDDEQDTVQVNKYFDMNGTQKIYDLTVGRYDVTVSAGPSYQTKRQEAAESMIEMVKAYPPLFQIAGDLLAKNLDWPGAKELADRLKKTLPPGLADDDQTDPEVKVQQLQAQNTQLQQQHDAVMTAAQQLQQDINTKKVETDAKKEIELFKASKQFELERLKLEAQRDIAEITTKSQDARERMKLDADMDMKLRVQQHEFAMRSADVGQESRTQDTAHAQALEQADQGHQHAIEQSEVGNQHALEQQDQAGQQALTQQEQAAKLAPKPTGATK